MGPWGVPKRHIAQKSQKKNSKKVPTQEHPRHFLFFSAAPFLFVVVFVLYSGRPEAISIWAIFLTRNTRKRKKEIEGGNCPEGVELFVSLFLD
jgi:hypothetical protein